MGTTENHEKICLFGDYVYLSCSEEGVRIVDVSDPENPALKGLFSDLLDAEEIFAKEDTIYVANQDGGMLMIDVSDPMDPQEITTYVTDGRTYGLFVEGDYVYMADGGEGLRILDASDPASIEEIGSSNPGGDSWAKDVFVENNMAFYTALDSGLRILDIADRSLPEELGVLIDEEYISSFVYNNDYTYMLCGAEGMKIADVSDPGFPVVSGWFNTSVNPIDIAVTDNIVYVTAQRDGIYIIQHDIIIDHVHTENAPKDNMSFTSYPNPFRTSTEFRFDLQSDADVSIYIKNILGQHVATILYQEQLTTGSYSYIWNCDSNKVFKSGMYFAVIETTVRNQKSVDSFKLIKLE